MMRFFVWPPNRFHKDSVNKSKNAANEKFESLWDVVLYMTNRRPGSAQSTSSGGSEEVCEDEKKMTVIAKWKR